MQSFILCAVLFTSSLRGALEWIRASRPGPPRNDAGLKIFEDAGRNPKIADSVQVTRISRTLNETWTWSINIIEVAAPDTRVAHDVGLDQANYTKNYRVAHTQWQLEWPLNDSLHSYLREKQLDLHISAYISPLLSNVTDKYDPNDNGNCTRLLGDECTEALTFAASSPHPIWGTIGTLKDCKASAHTQLSTFASGLGFSRCCIISLYYVAY